MTGKQWKARRVTIKDIARTAEVDPSTVTRALQGSDRVKKSTRDQIEKLALEMGYVPSAAARTLVTRRSRLVGVVIPDMTNPFFADLVRGIEDEAALHGLRILMRNTEGRESAEQDAVKLFRELNVDGILVPMARCPQEFYAHLENSLPVVHINRDEAPLNVSCDSAGGTYRMMEHLLGLGHRRIGFVNGPSGPAREPKRSAYEAALADHGIDGDNRLIYQFDGSLVSTETIADEMLSDPRRPTAVFAWNDVCAIGLIHALNRRGIDVPRDLSVAGHDDIDLSGRVLPPITTVRWPMYELGQAAVRYLNALHEDDRPVAPTVPEPALIVRESTGPAPT